MQSISSLSDSAAKATIILGAAWLVATLMRRSSASARYFLWTCALAAILALPLLSIWLPRWSVPVNRPLAGVVLRSAIPGGDAPADTGRTAAPRGARFREWPAAVWLAGALIALARLIAGHWRLHLAWRRAKSVAIPDWIDALTEARSRLHLRRATAVRYSTETDVPLSLGLVSPAVLLPDAASEWDGERRRIVLLHELTHARRRDPLLYAGAQLTSALYWFHPLAWLALARFRREQERSCDDAVLRAGTGMSAYAEHLVDIARSVASSGVGAVAVGMAQGSDLERRVRALLDPRRNRASLSGAACLAAVLAVLAVVVPLAALRAQSTKPSASLSGSIYDASGAAIPGARIVLQNVDGSNTEAARSDGAGVYKLSRIPAATYEMHVGAPGLAEFHKTIVLAGGDAPKMDVTLDMGQVTEAMEVVGKGPRPPQPATPRRIRVGGNVQATKLISSEKPVYPPGAEAAGIEGTVLLHAVISTQGDLANLSVMNASVDEQLARAALEAVKQWHYQPTLLNGEPVEIETTIAVTFRLQP